jgi:hypothetical protein
MQRVLLSMTWRERSLGHVRRSWAALLAAVYLSPGLLRAGGLYTALGRLFLLTMLGHTQYERLSAWRSKQSPPLLTNSLISSS